ncbi:carboxy terminal-processing peptidase [Wenzhouxiangella sp. AB-CW3]|uniref:carboxy terminal-processing peptidase n=1 Tax=Wenzhouxiangella sp. AB-CW3 TaxID=2771012 RepID=UPI00168BBB2C|nr:carboxy terminal-processing peptidase [Wenzhouxiangella sp. AB-CW3]QOC22799.1 carboxy terminal-processing peptidase [Wenzhouxiangella sp. AB-CW3]
MKTNLIRFSLLAVLALVSVPALMGLYTPTSAPAAITESSPDALAAEPHHEHASRLASRFLTSYHYHRQDLDDDMSSRIFDQYLRQLDPNRSFFTASDVDDMERYRDYLSDAIRQADLDPAYDMFNLYARRVDERTDHALALLKKGFDFDIEEEYRFDRREADWAADRESLDEIWRKRVKNDWLRLRLADQDDESIVETLTERYEGLQRRVHELNSEDVFSLFMNAFTRSVEPHSAYMSPRRSEDFEISMRLSLDGIGAMLQRETEYTTVMEVVPGGPADLDGRLQPGDRIIAVGQGEDGDMVDVVGWRLDHVVDLIRGERDTVVRLEVLPAETGLGGPSTELEITRNEVKLEEQAASKEVIEVPVGDETRRIGIVRVPVFYVDFQGRARNEPNYRSSTRDVRRLINELKSDGIDGLVVDLRGNGGGALVEATTMTGLFIDTGPVVQVRDSRGRVSLEEDREPGMAWEGPLGVLVDRRSASASEIFAAAIQDYGRGVVIGEPTFGKGTVQNLIDLDNMSRGEDDKMGQIKLTMAQFYRIAGGSTQAKGVVPDFVLPSPGDPEDWGESALDFAMPWGEIDATDFKPYADLSGLIDLARHRHEERVKTDDKFADLMAELAEWEEQRDRETVSLHEPTRRKEVEAAEERRASRHARGTPDLEEGLLEGVAAVDDDEDDEDDDDEAPDLFLTESARILSDLIDYDRDTHLLAHSEAAPSGIDVD